MSKDPNVTAWLNTYSSSPSLVISGDVVWPFANIPRSAMKHISGFFYANANFPDAWSIYGYSISAIGIVLSALSICTVWRKAVKDKNSFYILTLIIAVLDLCFNIGSVLVRGYRDQLRISGSDSYAVMLAMNLIRGVTFSLSL